MNNATQLQVWNNAAFDDHDPFLPINTSWSSSDCTKENLSPPAPNHSSKKTSIDAEIEAIQREITRLTTRLDALRLEKAKRAKRLVGRVVPAKFMEPRPNAVVSRKPEETPKAKVKISNNNNNNNSWRRGMSLGPAEIAATPATVQSRRKSCFWKLPEIEEEARAKTVGRVKKKDEAALVGQAQARKLFEREKVKAVCESNKKGLLRQGRVVASRYNSCCDVKKRSLPEGGSEVRVKKRWEIPKNGGEEETMATATATTTAVAVLPKIRTVKCVNDSPRDSGAAKRVAELVGKKPFFSIDEKDVCQVLDFAEEDG
ncbi:uncharacterized protein LOC109788222 [Cajanus cajan]|uniref:Uncharacterized protein n=1 Tax=Cajanus cajan TaxID=3821 RepID=A0A151RCF4_CAJCA|nr:uncharacterized protein LOC109788222 [Cajanus cajan]KYP40153.1 hypothetical protein KK1_038522 [Cajanus cajan]